MADKPALPAFLAYPLPFANHSANDLLKDENNSSATESSSDSKQGQDKYSSASTQTSSLISNVKTCDADFTPYSQRPVLTGTTKVLVPHMYDNEAPPLTIEFSNNDLQYDLRPKYFGKDKRTDQLTIYYDAQDPQYYLQTLPNPILTVWILIKITDFLNGTYSKRRLVEEGLRMNVCVRLMNPNKFDMAIRRNPGDDFVVYEGEKVKVPQVVIPRLGANVDYFGLAVMRYLQGIGVRVLNPVASVEIARDKLYTQQILSGSGVPIPRSLLSRTPIELPYVESIFSYPFVVKLASGSRGEAVWKVDNREELNKLLNEIDTSKPMIFQEFVKETKGRDIRCLVVGDRVVSSMMRIAEKGSFKSNFHLGGSVRQISISKELEALAIKTARLCKLDITGVDLLMGADSYKICEVNSSPGFEGIEQATSCNVAKEMIELTIKCVKGTYVTDHANANLAVEAPSKALYPVQPEHVLISPTVKPETENGQNPVPVSI